MKELEEDKRREAQAGGYASLNALEPQGQYRATKMCSSPPQKRRCNILFPFQKNVVDAKGL